MPTLNGRSFLCLQKVWRPFQTTDFLTGRANFLCFLMGRADSRSAVQRRLLLTWPALRLRLPLSSAYPMVQVLVAQSTDTPEPMACFPDVALESVAARHRGAYSATTAAALYS